jgi:hypothetical protein
MTTTQNTQGTSFEVTPGGEGYGGWNLFVDGEYWQSYATKRAAFAAGRLAVAAPFKTYITKSRAGHYTVTIKKFNVEYGVYQEVFKRGYIGTVSFARTIAAEYLAVCV